MPTDKVFVITADFISSRATGASRQTLEPRITAFEAYRFPSQQTRLSLYRGDELQVLCSPTPELPRLLRVLLFCMQPYPMRIGIGYGGYDGELRPEDSWNMSGEAFFAARQALQNVKNVKDTAIAFECGRTAANLALNSIYTLYTPLLHRWTPKQWQAVMTYEEQGTYARSSKKLHKSIATIDQHVKAANWPAITEAERMTGLYILEFFGINT